jgi:hypothetical protein
MSTVTPVPRRRSRYVSLLRITGALAIVANHVGVPHANLAWILLDVFFVVAGMNMAGALESDQSIASYALSRIKRLGPEMLAVWCVAVAFLVLGRGTSGMSWFVATGPVFAQNLAHPFFAYTAPQDWVFTPLWFIAALMQLQLLLFGMRRVLVRTRPWIVLVAAVGIALLFRTLYTMLLAQSPASPAVRDALILYIQPLTHLEAIVLGVLMGRGGLPRIGRLLPLFCLLAISLVAINLARSPGEVRDAIGIAAGLDFEYPLRLHYSHIWGYSVIALAAASLASRNGRLADAIEKLPLPASVDKAVLTMASLTYGAYVFHGTLMATGVNAASILARLHAPGLLLLFTITALQAFLLAWLFQKAVAGIKGLTNTARAVVVDAEVSDGGGGIAI